MDSNMANVIIWKWQDYRHLKNWMYLVHIESETCKCFIDDICGHAKSLLKIIWKSTVEKFVVSTKGKKKIKLKHIFVTWKKHVL